MRKMRLLVMVLACALWMPGGRAQEKPKPGEQFRSVEEAKPITPLRVQVVFSEYEGEKKISSLPYSFLVNADDRLGRPGSNLRMGLRVPVVAGTKDSTQYLDVGTNIDCSARTVEGGHFRLDLVVERSSLYTTGPEKKSLDWSPGDPPLSAQPIIRQYKAYSNLLVRDGQTVQSTMATDPVSGRMVKIEVTANVVK